MYYLESAKPGQNTFRSHRYAANQPHRDRALMLYLGLIPQRN
jgi:hypothetical protein